MGLLVSLVRYLVIHCINSEFEQAQCSRLLPSFLALLFSAAAVWLLPGLCLLQSAHWICLSVTPFCTCCCSQSHWQNQVIAEVPQTCHFLHPLRLGSKDIFIIQSVADSKSCICSVVPCAWAVHSEVFHSVPGLGHCEAAFNLNKGTFSWSECVFGV